MRVYNDIYMPVLPERKSSEGGDVKTTFDLCNNEK